MSEIIRTEQVDIEESNDRNDRTTLADILTGIGWLGYQGTKLAFKGAVAGAKLTAKGIQAVRDAHNEPLTYTSANHLIQSAPDASHAIKQLSSHPGFHIPKQQIPALKLHINKLAQTNDIEGVKVLSQKLIRNRQTKLQADVTLIARESFSHIGYSPETLKAGDGLIKGHSPDGRKNITVAVEKSRDGGLRMHLDAHGFNGQGCTETLDQLQTEMRKRGVRFSVNSRRRKDRSPAIDARRLPQNVNMRRPRYPFH